MPRGILDEFQDPQFVAAAALWFKLEYSILKSSSDGGALHDGTRLRLCLHFAGQTLPMHKEVCSQTREDQRAGPLVIRQKNMDGYLREAVTQNPR